ncbi:ATP synthase subunit C lysine N-methyltransferase isoform X1 [Toxotes jaculatrix]|uniref:ATP synthase subunit C lysine N-methyltransferase isoform X1 n=2 Tax=Toxotes jaculatrix TaxID=941984 RepID=UPI001B3AAD67|nr:ATP synthase subunit C lysine N-methyltransferase isoform X1 [Toxotes jaculatrix]
MSVRNQRQEAVTEPNLHINNNLLILEHSAPCLQKMWEKKKMSVQDEQENMMIRSRLSTVPYLPSSKDQTLNTMKLLEGRRGRLADLGSGDGRLVFAASAAGFQCTGFEINSILVTYAKSKALWMGVPSSQATFVKKDFWKTDLSSYNNVTAFLAPGVMTVLGDKLLKELPDDALVIACRFPFPNWPHQSSVGSGLDQTFAYDISSVRSHLRNVPNAVV